MKYILIPSLILMVLFAVALGSPENQDLPASVPPEAAHPNSEAEAVNQECNVEAATYDMKDCYSFLTNKKMPYPPNSCCFVLNDLSSIDAAGKSFTICQCLRALVDDPDVISSRANVMAEGCSVAFTFDVFAGMSCS